MRESDNIAHARERDLSRKQVVPSRFFSPQPEKQGLYLLFNNRWQRRYVPAQGAIALCHQARRRVAGGDKDLPACYKKLTTQEPLAMTISIIL